MKKYHRLTVMLAVTAFANFSCSAKEQEQASAETVPSINIEPSSPLHPQTQRVNGVSANQLQKILDLDLGHYLVKSEIFNEMYGWDDKIDSDDYARNLETFNKLSAPILDQKLNSLGSEGVCSPMLKHRSLGLYDNLRYNIESYILSGAATDDPSESIRKRSLQLLKLTKQLKECLGFEGFTAGYEGELTILELNARLFERGLVPKEFVSSLIDRYKNKEIRKKLFIHSIRVDFWSVLDTFLLNPEPFYQDLADQLEDGKQNLKTRAFDPDQVMLFTKECFENIVRNAQKETNLPSEPLNFEEVCEHSSRELWGYSNAIEAIPMAELKQLHKNHDNILSKLLATSHLPVGASLVNIQKEAEKLQVGRKKS